MYKSFSPSVLKEMEKRGHIQITAKNGWEQVWSAQPSFISYCIGNTYERIFSCYYSGYDDQIQITSIEAMDLISKNKGLIDAYMYLAIKGIIRLANNIGVKYVVVDSFISSAADHMLDLGFRVGLSNGSRGCKKLKG